jgi:hypothetical protein
MLREMKKNLKTKSHTEQNGNQLQFVLGLFNQLLDLTAADFALNKLVVVVAVLDDVGAVLDDLLHVGAIRGLSNKNTNIDDEIGIQYEQNTARKNEHQRETSGAR